MSKRPPAKKAKKVKKKAKKPNRKQIAEPEEALPVVLSTESLLAGLGGRRRRRREVDEAQAIMYQAWEANSKRQRLALARKALRISRECADAYVLLAAEAPSLEESIALYREGVAAGERALGKQAFKEDKGYFWGLLETRPYMRARAGLARSLWESGSQEEAIQHYQEMLILNPDDNQGIRDLLMASLLVLGQDKEAEKLYKKYPKDGMAVWMYSRALLDYRKHGGSKASSRSLKAALETNTHVPEYLLGYKELPRGLPSLYSFGDENEAILYVYGSQAAWQSTPGSLEWLRARAEQ